MNIGSLNRRITVTNYGTPTVTDIGGAVKGAATSFETWCNAKPLSQSEQIRNGLQLGESTYKFTFRYEKGNEVTQATDLTFDSVKFRVASILDINEAYRVVEVLAAKRTN